MKHLSVLLVLLCSCSGPPFSIRDLGFADGDAQAPPTGADGAQETGGRGGSGGAGARATISTGGSRASGGAASGGASATGGAPPGTGGREVSTGGVSAMGGTTATGGTTTTGGTTATGGAAGSDSGVADAGRKCVTDLSGVGTGDFRISFTLTTTTKADVALLSQRVGCDQSSMLWGVSLNYNGQVAAATADGLPGHWTATTEANSVADGKPHAIMFERTSGKIWISRDGVVDSIPVDDPYSLGALATLRIGTDDCANFWSAQKAGALISDVCISRL